jgi:predicted transcriptional regulator with HTH domain
MRETTALPISELEDAYLGEVSDALKSKAANVAGAQIGREVTLAGDVQVPKRAND